MKLKKIAKFMLPPIIVEIAKYFLKSPYGWYGDFTTWEEAKKHSTGYDVPQIVEKVREAMLKVKNGEAVYERDGVLFDKIEYSWPLLSGLLLAASTNNGHLSVLDFGGSLGSTYFQNRKFLERLPSVSWNIIEQKLFVEEGKKYFENEVLHFYYENQIEECVQKEKPVVLLLSSVLQYIEQPYVLLDHLLSFKFLYVIVDRTPFNYKPKDRLTVQKVPPWIYEASYPCWLFDKAKFIDFFEKHNFDMIECFTAIDGEIKDCVDFYGYIWKLKQ